QRAHPERLRDRPDDAAATGRLHVGTRCQCLIDESFGGSPLEALSGARTETRRIDCSERPTPLPYSFTRSDVYARLPGGPSLYVLTHCAARELSAPQWVPTRPHEMKE